MKGSIFTYIVLSILFLFVLVCFCYSKTDINALYVVDNPNTTYIPDNPNTKAMVIVEPRKHKLLKYVCKNFDANMDPSWDLYVFHGKSNGEFAREATEDITSRTVHLLPLDVDNLDANAYNLLFKQLSFWNKVKAENILVFQTDTALCSMSKFRIEDFMKYDYIGCAAFNKGIGNERNVWGDYLGKNNSFYGIGGLSFRKNSFQKQSILKHIGIDPNTPEDVFYSNCVEDSPNKPESYKVLSNFCTQDSFASRSFGAHKMYASLSKNELHSFYQFCPESKELINQK